jgi:hypothetical protein
MEKAMNHKIVRVTETEFELEDGTICPIPFELDEVPTVEEFQKTYDEWLKIFQEKQLLEEHESEVS